MKNLEVYQYQQLIKSLFEKTKSLEDFELQSHWARYLCVLVSGYIEVAVQAMYSKYAREKAPPNIANLVESHLRNFQNPKMEKILELTGQFNGEWEQSLRNETEGELKDAVDSIVANRHLIAHGRSVGITYVRIRQYFEDIEKVLKLIKSQF